MLSENHRQQSDNHVVFGYQLYHNGIFSLSCASNLHVHITEILYDCRAASIGVDSCGAMSALIANGLHLHFSRTSRDEYDSIFNHYQSQQPGITNCNSIDVLDANVIEYTPSIGKCVTVVTMTTTAPTTTTTK